MKPEKLDEFERIISIIKAEQAKLQGCVSVNYIKRFYTFDGVENGKPPREISKIVKCVKYYSVLEFDNIENSGKQMAVFLIIMQKKL